MWWRMAVDANQLKRRLGPLIQRFQLVSRLRKNLARDKTNHRLHGMVLESRKLPWE
jgi:hypothetical protein